MVKTDRTRSFRLKDEFQASSRFDNPSFDPPYVKVDDSDEVQSRINFRVSKAAPSTFLSAKPGKSYKIAGVDVFFPKEKTPFSAQLAFMSKATQAICKSENALLESPTGTGKSLALLCSVLSWQRHDLKLKKIEKNEKIPRKGTISQDTDQSFICNDLEKFKYSEFDPPTLTSTNEPPAVVDFLSQTFESKYFGNKMTQSFEAKQELTENGEFADPVGTVNDNQRVDYIASSALKTRRDMSDTDHENCNNVDTSPTAVFIASRTHAQIEQLIGELKRCPKEILKGVKMTVLASRLSYCINDKVCAAKTLQKRNEQCKEAIRGGGSQTRCFYYNGVRSHSEPFPPGNIWDIEDLVENAKSNSFCPFFVAKKYPASLIFCPYNYLIDPVARDSMGILDQLQNAVIVIDEAHNIESALCDAASVDIKPATMSLLRMEMNLRTVSPDPYENISAFTDGFCSWAQEVRLQVDGKKNLVIGGDSALSSLRKHCAVTSMSINILQKTVSKASDGKSPELSSGSFLFMISQTILPRILSVLGLMLMNDEKYAKDFRIVVHFEEVKENLSQFSSQLDGMCIDFVCLNPAVAFRSLEKKARSVILCSGTLSPVKSFSHELGVDFKYGLQASHVINLEKQLWIGTVGSDCNEIMECTYNNKRRPEYQKALGMTFLACVRKIPNGVLCFFPSYTFMKECIETWESQQIMKQMLEVKSKIFVEGDAPLNEQLKQYLEAANTEAGAIYCCVFRARLSEGMDFSDEAARGVFIVGIPYPSFVDIRVKLKRDYCDLKSGKKTAEYGAASGLNSLKKHFDLTGNDWYNLQAYRALNQAIGRAIRHKNDFGAIVFLDYRFLRENVLNNLSLWVRKEALKQKHLLGLNEAGCSLERFFSGLR